MVRPCPPTLALLSAFVSGVKWAGKIPNISLESSSQTAGTITEKAAAPGTEAYETHPIYLWLRPIGLAFAAAHACVLSAGRCAFAGASFAPPSLPTFLGHQLAQDRLANHDLYITT